MAGKNHIEKSFRILVDDSGGNARDLTGDLIPGSCQGGGIVFDEVDMLGVSEAIYNYLAGHGKIEVTAQFHLNDTATTGAYTVLTGNDGGTGTVELRWGQSGAAPTTGDPQFDFEASYVNVSAALSGGKAILNAKFVQTGSTAGAWGTVS